MYKKVNNKYNKFLPISNVNIWNKKQVYKGTIISDKSKLLLIKSN